jgi:hypothetical protein
MAQNQRPPPHDRGDGPLIEHPAKRLSSDFSEDDDAPQLPPAINAAPSSPIAFGDEFALGVVMDMSDWAASHLRYAADAAWRGDVEPLGVHLRQARNALVAARKTYDALVLELAAPP